MIIEINTDKNASREWLEKQIEDIDHFGEHSFICITNVIEMKVNENENLIFKVGKKQYYIPMIFTNNISVKH